MTTLHKIFSITLATFGLATSMGAHAALTAAEATRLLTTYEIGGLGFAQPLVTSDSHGYEYGDCWNSGAQSNCSTATTIHGGTDAGSTANDCGKKVFATSDGVVRYAADAGPSWRGVITIQHRTATQNAPGAWITQERVSVYGHIAPLDTTVPGIFVRRGDHIGYIANGTQGACADTAFAGVARPTDWNVAWASHLHFEIRTNLDMPDAAWYSMADFNEAVRGTTCYNQLRASATCRLAALTAKGYTDPYAFVINHPIPATGQLLDRCMQKFVAYFGVKTAPTLLRSDGFFYQYTSGTSNYPVYAMAIQATATLPTSVYYYWNGWGSLSAASCNL